MKCEYGWLSSQRCRRRAMVLVTSDTWQGGSPRCPDHAAQTVALLIERNHKNVQTKDLS